MREESELFSSEIPEQFSICANQRKEDLAPLACVLISFVELICRADVVQRVIHVAAGQEKWSKMGLFGEILRASPRKGWMSGLTRVQGHQWAGIPVSFWHTVLERACEPCPVQRLAEHRCFRLSGLLSSVVTSESLFRINTGM